MNEQRGTLRKTVPIEWHIPDGMLPQYATSTIVQGSENEIFISFFHIVPPLITGAPEETETQIQNLATVQAECVARVVISPKHLDELIAVLQAQAKNLSSESRQKDDVEQ